MEVFTYSLYCLAFIVINLNYLCIKTKPGSFFKVIHQIIIIIIITIMIINENTIMSPIL